jgi:hypothetical protein
MRTCLGERNVSSCEMFFVRSCCHCVTVGDDDNALMASECASFRRDETSVCPVLRKRGDDLKMECCAA